ncbi:elongator complex protein 5 isoform X2 [Periplaneta americana]|uniref:elongator complex protein 5 isoform X2 n=1 Tax=Periplaneta americana TaxID=6978 RepID=UPI0037E92A41
MLLNIVTGKQPSPLVCIQDSRQQNGIRLLKAFVQHRIDTNKKHVHIMCYEHPPAKLKNVLKNSNADHVHFHDCFSDPREWFKRINVSEIICLMHEDTLPFSHAALPQLRHLATAYIEITAPTQSSNGNPIASTIYKKKSGRVLKEVEYYSVDSENRLKAEKLTSAFAGPAASDQEMKDDDDLLADLTTFKLSLGQQEKQARSELVLPYLRMNKEKGGKVFYQPDAADDWDEEDPDDDLDV